MQDETYSHFPVWFEMHGGGAAVNENKGLKKDRRVSAGIEKKNIPENGNRFLLARKIKFVVSFYKECFIRFFSQN